MHLASLFDVLRTKIVGATKTIHFHVGAHKTATTYMQSRLRANRHRLRKAGVDFIDLWARGYEHRVYRKGFSKVMRTPAVDEEQAAQVAKQLQSIVTKGRSSASSLVVVSYENVLGGYDLTRGDALYPNAGRAAQHLVDAFPGWDLKVFLSIRSLDRFVESGYVQRVVSRRETRTFKQYLSRVGFDLASMSWIPVVRAIESAVGRDNMFIWEYEDFVAEETFVWDALLAQPGAEASLVQPAKKNNYSLSVKGLKYMRSLNKVATRADLRKFRPFVKDCFGSRPGFKPPELLDDVRRRQLIANYERDRMELGMKPGESGEDSETAWR